MECILKHTTLPIAILYSNPFKVPLTKESLPKAVKLLLKDTEVIGLDRWKLVEEIT